MSLITLNSLTPSSIFSTQPPLLRFSSTKQNPNQRCKKKRNKRVLVCKAELAQDAPFAMAIGACVLNSLVFPLPNSQDENGDGGIDSTDARFAVMGIISFIPYFNWLGWVFAWLDTNKSRYAVYSIVYLLPYLRTNLSLSPEESWLPITSIVICIIHIQLEASIRNGDIQGFQLFNSALKHMKDGHQELPKKGRKKEGAKLPSAPEQRNELQGWGVPEKPRDRQLEEEEDAEQ